MGEFADMMIEQSWDEIWHDQPFERVPSLQEQASDFVWVQKDRTEVHMLNMCERHLRFTLRKFEDRQYLEDKMRQVKMVIRLIEEQVHIPPHETVNTTILDHPRQKKLLKVLQQELQRRREQSARDRGSRYNFDYGVF